MRTEQQNRNELAFNRTNEIHRTVRAMKFADSKMGEAVSPLAEQIGLSQDSLKEIANSPDKSNQMAQIFSLATIPEDNIALFEGNVTKTADEAIKSLSTEQKKAHEDHLEKLESIGHTIVEAEKEDNESESTEETEEERED